MTTAYKPFTEPEVERGVLNHLATLSATSIDDARLALAKSGLMQEDFSVPMNRSLFLIVARQVLDKGQVADPFTVKPQLEATHGATLTPSQWADVVETLMGVSIQTSSVFESHCKLLRSLAVRRLAVSHLDAAAALARDLNQDPNVVIASVTGKLAAIAGSGSNIQSLRQVVDTLVERYDKVQAGEANTIIPTGLAKLDRIIGGWQPTLNLVGALPGVGKSALFATTIQSMARRGVRVGLISLEDEAAWLGYRLWSDESGVNQFHLRFEKTSEREHDKLSDGVTRMNGYWDNVLVADGSDSGHHIESVVSIAQNLILNHKCQCILVDHLGEVMRESDERYDLEVSEHLSAMRRVANAHQVPMVVAMHLRRRQGLGPGDEPTLQDFANSAGSERKARVALGLSREPDSDSLTIYVLKNTNGKAGLNEQFHFKGAAAMLSAVEAVPAYTNRGNVSQDDYRRESPLDASPSVGVDVRAKSPDNGDEVVAKAGRFSHWFKGEGLKTTEEDDA